MRDQQMESAVMGRKMPFSVYLPKSYDGQKEYPVLYLLHGADGNHNDWMAQGMLNPYASAAEAAGWQGDDYCLSQRKPRRSEYFLLRQLSGKQHEVYDLLL